MQVSRRHFMHRVCNGWLEAVSTCFKWRDVGHTIEGEHFSGPLRFATSLQPLAHSLANQRSRPFAGILGNLVALLSGFVVKAGFEVMMSVYASHTAQFGVASGVEAEGARE